MAYAIVRKKLYITSPSLFGSRARGDFDALSDYDFHVGFDYRLGTLSAFLTECEESESELESKCDFTSTPMDRLSPLLAEEIEREIR